MRASDKLYWLAFVVCQIAGFVLLLSSGVHINVVPRRIGWALLLPGTFVAGKLAEMMRDSTLPIVIVLVNFGAWYAFRKVWLVAKSRVPAGK